MIFTVPFVMADKTEVPGCIMQNMLRLRAALIAQPALRREQLARLVDCPCSTVDQLLWLGKKLCIVPRGALA